MDLSDGHKTQIARFSTFFRGKRDRALAESEEVKDNFLTDNLADESAIFNYADVRQLLETYHAQVMARMREDLEKTANLSAVFAAQLLGQAQAAGLALQVDDISVIEDQSRVAEVGSLPAVSAPLLAAPNKPLTPLAAVGGGGAVDTQLLQELQDLREENRMMKDRNVHMQQEMSTVLRERSALSSQLEQAGLQAAAAPPAPQQLGDSAQFRELKAIVKKKTTENKELRERLAAAGLALPDAGEGIELEADSD